ncbi:MAG TPA: tyrosine/phenylalanine carboxypeptidase domain-containing protein, partial [Patescibacteria group bacterium]
MGLIADLNPTNYQQEKERFLADPTFNPQFKYVRKFSEEELLSKGLPSKPYLTLAWRVLDQALTNFTPEEFELARGLLLTQETVTQAIRDFLHDHHLTEQISIVWSPNFVSRASVTDNNVIKLRLPCSFRDQDLDSLIYHEIGTHTLRRINYQKQPWYKKKKRFGFGPYLKTEEGLAVLHSLLPQQNSFAYLAAVNYLTVQKAQT